jgi:hypothetical protein
LIISNINELILLFIKSTPPPYLKKGRGLRKPTPPLSGIEGLGWAGGEDLFKTICLFINILYNK